MNSADCRLYSAELYDLSEPSPTERACLGHNQLLYGGRQLTTAGLYDATDARYRSVDAREDLYDAGSSLTSCKPADHHQHIATCSAYFDVAYRCAYSARTDCCALPYCTENLTSVQHDCAIERNDERTSLQTSIQCRQQLARPTTYKWMTVRRAPPKTASGLFTSIKRPLSICCLASSVVHALAADEVAYIVLT